MDFYHVLPSNTSPETFPQNHASSYSTPIFNPYHLPGNWEVAVTDITYSNCINTFNNDYIIVKDSAKKLTQIGENTKVEFSLPDSTEKLSDIQYRKFIVKELNKVLDGIIKFKIIKGGKFVSYSFPTDKFAVSLCKPLTDFFKLNDVLTPDDIAKTNYFELRSTANELDSVKCVIPIIRYDTPSISFTIKKENEHADIKSILKAFHQVSFLPVKFYLEMDGNHLVLTKPKNHHFFDIAMTFSKEFYMATGFRNNGLHWMSRNRFFASDLRRSFKEKWKVQLHYLHTAPFYNKESYRVTLAPKMFQSQQEVCKYLTEVIKTKDIEFVYDNNKVKLNILSDDKTVEMSDDVRDILGFDRNIYNSKGSHLSEGSLSLTRRINYLYIYSNIGQLVRIGDTEAPLLAVLPFNPSTCDVLSEINFRYPMYVKVNADYISQINIEIYDGAGKLIPFHQDAVTNLRLHFRRV